MTINEIDEIRIMNTKALPQSTTAIGVLRRILCTK